VSSSRSAATVSERVVNQEGAAQVAVHPIATAGRSAWLWIGAPFLALAALYAPLFPSMVQEWAEFPNLSHGFAIPFISAYLIWVRRQELAHAPIRPSAWGLPLLVVGLAALVVGTAGEEPFLARISMIASLLGLTLFVAGPAVWKNALLGSLYLAFMIPPPWSTLKLITYRSRLLDAEVSAAALSWLGVPVHRDGVFLHLPNITLEVADECSSIPAIAALLALGVAYAGLTRRPIVARTILVGVTLPLAIVANIIRIISVSWAAYAIGPWTLSTTYHMFNGTVNFVFTFILLMGVDAVLARLIPGRSR
jgi:exosortase